MLKMKEKYLNKKKEDLLPMLVKLPKKLMGQEGLGRRPTLEDFLQAVKLMEGLGNTLSRERIFLKNKAHNLQALSQIQYGPILTKFTLKQIYQVWPRRGRKTNLKINSLLQALTITIRALLELAASL